MGAQAWMTGTDEGVFDPLGQDARRFHIEDAHPPRIGAEIGKNPGKKHADAR